MKQKVLIYLLRPGIGAPEVLVFEHRDFPEAGVQVPAGTVDLGETVEAAASRELMEETGLSGEQAGLVRKLANFPEPAWNQHRHVFLFEALTPLPELWSHIVQSCDEDRGMVFNFFWIAATPSPVLAGGQDRHLWLAVSAYRAHCQH